MAKRYKRDWPAWANAYQVELSTMADCQHGRICWDTAKFLFAQGYSPIGAARSASKPYLQEACA
jgi:hypothetical protein